MTIRLRWVFEGTLADHAILAAQFGFPGTHVEAVTPGGLSYLGSRYPDGVKDRNILSVPAGQWELFVDLPASDGMTAAFFAWCTSQLGKPYDLDAVMSNFVGMRDFRNANKWFCSEYIACGLEACGWFKNPLALGIEKLTPRDLAIAVSANGVPITW